MSFRKIGGSINLEMDGKESESRGRLPGVIVLLLFGFGAALFFFNLHPQSDGTTIDALENPRTRLRAYHRVWIQTKSANRHEFYKPLLKFSNFKKDHSEIRFMKIPMSNPEEPRYLVLRKRRMLMFSHQKYPWSSWEMARQWISWKDWWASRGGRKIHSPPMETPSTHPPGDEFIISMFDHEGNLLDEKDRPFGGNNLTEEGEVIFDINRDGLVERVTALNYGSSTHKNLTIRTVKVTRIDEETEEIFRLAFQFNPYQRTTYPPIWGFDCADHDGDGTLEIRVGPLSGSTIKPDVIFRWNADEKTFLSPSGDSGPHHRVIRNNDELNELFDLGSFPRDPTVPGTDRSNPDR